MSAPKPKDGCLRQIAPVIVAMIVMSSIQGFFGMAASMWFGGGFLVAALVAFWEAGANLSHGSLPMEDHDD